MLKFFLGNCNCYSANGSDISAEIEFFNLDIVEAYSNEEIKIYLDLKFSLNCTTVFKGDAIYLSKYIPDLKKEQKIFGENLSEENLIYLDESLENSYSGLVHNTFDLSPDMYNVIYIRPLQKYDLKNTIWKILGFSKTFKLDLMEDGDCSFLRKSSVSKTNTSFLDFFNKSVLGFNDSPPKLDLQISKLQKITIDEENDPRKTENQSNQSILEKNQEKPDISVLKTSNEAINLKEIMKENRSFCNQEEKAAGKSENNLNEVTDAQKFYAESLMRIKKINQDYFLSPKNRFPSTFSSDKFKKKKNVNNNNENAFDS